MGTSQLARDPTFDVEQCALPAGQTVETKFFDGKPHLTRMLAIVRRRHLVNRHIASLDLQLIDPDSSSSRWEYSVQPKWVRVTQATVGPPRPPIIPKLPELIKLVRAAVAEVDDGSTPAGE